MNETKAIRCYTTNGNGLSELRLEHRPGSLSLDSNQVRVAVHAVSLNYRDLLVARGAYGGPQNPPIIVASDMAGGVLEVGSEVESVKVGERVINAPVPAWPDGRLQRTWSRSFVGGQGTDGVLAEEVIYPASGLVSAPHNTSHEQAATLVVAGLTAWAALVTHGAAGPGQWALIHGTGGVAIFAAQLAAMLGVHVIQTTSNPEKARRLKETFGVAETLDYRDECWPDQVREITSGRGVDVVVELAGGSSLARSVEACNYGARVGVIGVLDGLESSLNVFSLIMRQISLRGIYMESVAELDRFARAVEAGKLTPVIDRVFEFKDAQAAYAHLESQQHFGKVVIRVCDA